MKQIPYSQEAVYRNISDLRNLEKVQDRIQAERQRNPGRGYSRILSLSHSQEPGPDQAP